MQVQYDIKNMSLENGTTQEKIPVPQDAKAMIEEYLTYKDLSTEIKEVERNYYVEMAENTPEVLEYAEALRKSADKVGMEKLLNIANDLRASLRADARQLNLQLRPTSHSVSWALLGLGKQLHQTELPKENPEHREEDPLASREDQVEILHAYLGHEAYDAFYTQKWNEIAENNPKLSQAMPLLIKNPEGGKLSKEDMSELGKLLHKAANESFEEKMGTQPAIFAEAKKEPKEESLDPQNSIAAELVRSLNTLNRNIELERQERLRTQEDEEDEEDAAEEYTDAHEELAHATEHVTPATPETQRQAAVRAAKVVEQKGVTPAKLAKAGALGVVLIPVAIAGVTAWEFAKTSWQSAKGMFDVLKKWVKSGLSFKKLNESADKAGAGGGGHDKKDDHGKGGHDAGHGHADHGHGDHGHADHGHHDAGHGHAAGGHGHAGGGHGHGGGHGKGHGGGHAKKRSKKKKSGGGHGGHH